MRLLCCVIRLKDSAYYYGGSEPGNDVILTRDIQRALAGDKKRCEAVLQENLCGSKNWEIAGIYEGEI